MVLEPSVEVEDRGGATGIVLRCEDILLYELPIESWDIELDVRPLLLTFDPRMIDCN